MCFSKSGTPMSQGTLIIWLNLTAAGWAQGILECQRDLKDWAEGVSILLG